MAELAPRAVKDYLAESLQLIAAEAPRHFTAMRERLGALALWFQVDGERAFRVCLTDEPLWITEPDDRSDEAVRVELSATGLERLVRGEFTLPDAVRGGELAIHGSLRDCRRLLGAFDCWLHAALRVSRFHLLHRAFLDRLNQESSR